MAALNVNASEESCTLAPAGKEVARLVIGICFFNAKNQASLGPWVGWGPDYGVNDIGQRVTIDRSGSAFASSVTETVGYNSRGEVVNTAIPNNPDRARSYNFDGVGNRTSSTKGIIETDYIPNTLNEYVNVGGINQVHDDDGNLIDDGMFIFKWDAENQLVSVTDKVNGNVIIEYKYDFQSRRIERANSEGKTSWVYHGWNPCAQYLNGVLGRLYTWGIDLSGGQHGAGGVSGLLAVTKTESKEHFYPSFDGNISEYISDQQITVAHYEYDAFGNTVVKNGIEADFFEHRFSTKPIDEETGFYCYGYRYYDPVTGRWPSRDPIAEQGGLNLYGFLNNQSLLKIDYLSLKQTATVDIRDEDTGVIFDRDRVAKKIRDTLGWRFGLDGLFTHKKLNPIYLNDKLDFFIWTDSKGIEHWRKRTHVFYGDDPEYVSLVGKRSREAEALWVDKHAFPGYKRNPSDGRWGAGNGSKEIDSGGGMEFLI